MAGASRTGVGIAGAGIGLALGAGLGVFLLSPNIPGATSADTSGATEASSEHESLEAKEQLAQRKAAAADEVVAASGQDIIDGVLDEQPVLVLATADADEDDVEKLRASLQRAGAIDSGLINLSEKFFSQDGADELKTIVANTLPAGTELSAENRDPGTHAGQALGAALTFAAGTDTPNSTTEDRALLLETLADAKYLDYESGTILPGQAVVLVTGAGAAGGATGGSAEFVAKSQVAFARALDEAGGATVVAGRAGDTDASNAVEQLRADDAATAAVSTIDAVDQTWGRLATVLAVAEQLTGASGAYGFSDSADAVLPDHDAKFSAATAEGGSGNNDEGTGGEGTAESHNAHGHSENE